jgi:hypothetical protein
VDYVIAGFDDLIAVLAAKTLISEGKKVLIIPTYPTNMDEPYYESSRRRFLMSGLVMNAYIKSQLGMNTEEVISQYLSQITAADDTPATLIMNPGTSLAKSQPYRGDCSTAWVALNDDKIVISDGYWPLMQREITTLRVIKEPNEAHGLSLRSTPYTAINYSKLILTSQTNENFDGSARSSIVRLGEALNPLHNFSKFTELHRIVDIMSALSIREILSGDLSEVEVIDSYTSRH